MANVQVSAQPFAVSVFALGGDGARGKVDVAKIRVHDEVEVVHLRDAGRRKRVGPVAKPARPVLDVEGDGPSCRRLHGGDDFLRHVVADSRRLAVEHEREVVEERVLRRQPKPHVKLARLVVGIAKRVGALERHAVGRVPEQPLLAVRQIEIDRRARRFEPGRDGVKDWLLAFQGRPQNPCLGRHLTVLPAP